MEHESWTGCTCSKSSCWNKDGDCLNVYILLFQQKCCCVFTKRQHSYFARLIILVKWRSFPAVPVYVKPASYPKCKHHLTAVWCPPLPCHFVSSLAVLFFWSPFYLSRFVSSPLCLFSDHNTLSPTAARPTRCIMAILAPLWGFQRKSFERFAPQPSGMETHVFGPGPGGPSETLSTRGLTFLDFPHEHFFFSRRQWRVGGLLHWNTGRQTEMSVLCSIRCMYF